MWGGQVYNKYPTLQAILQSKVTVLMLTSLSVLSAAKQYLGDPIHCIFDTRYKVYLYIQLLKLSLQFWSEIKISWCFYNDKVVYLQPEKANDVCCCYFL